MKGGRTRIFLISPSWIIRTGLSHIIGKEQDLEIVDSASDLSCLSSGHLASLHPQVIVLDPSASSAAGIHSLRSYYESLNEYIVIGALNAALTRIHWLLPAACHQSAENAADGRQGR